METLLEIIRTNWVLIMAIFGIYGSWIRNEMQNKQQEAEIKSLKKRMFDIEQAEIGYRPYKDFAKDNRARIEMLEKCNQQFDVTMAEIKSRLCGIETNILWIKDAILNKANNN